MPLENQSQSGLEVDQRTPRDGHLAPIPVLPQEEEKITYHDDGKIIDFHDGGMHVAVGPPPIIQADPGTSTPTPDITPRILGLKRKTFFCLLLAIFIITLGGAIGGGVGGVRKARKSKESDSLSNSKGPVTPTTNVSLSNPPERYINTGLAALQWIDLHGTLHRNVYYQDRTNKIRESAWDNGTSWRSPWQINIISGGVKPGTPLAAVAGYPHASYDYSPVKNVYHMTANDELFERQAPSNDSQAWEDDNFSGLYQGYNSTFLAAYWNQDFDRESQQLIVLFQEDDFANGITQGRYTSDSRTSNPWIADKFGFSQPQGSTFALCPVNYRNGEQVMLYTVDSGRSLEQHEYTISETSLDPGTVVSLTRESATGLVVEPRSPLAISVQDNQPLYTVDTLPECAKRRPLTHLILYTSQDSQRLILNAWNCSTGVLDHTDQIKPLQKTNTTYLALSALNDRDTEGVIYIMFDSGDGPQIEEWTVPTRTGDSWLTSRNVTSDFDLRDDHAVQRVQERSFGMDEREPLTMRIPPKGFHLATY
ncbi:MAG: hypothetical protein Q9168_005240 [Polycauliona sp. 1 TL-2023]